MKKIIILILCLFTFGCGKETVYQDETNDFINVKESSIEVYSDIYLNDIIDILNNDINITSDNIKIDTTELGDQEFDIYYTYNNKKYVKHLNITVLDTTSPLVFSGTKKKVKTNYDEDMCNLITYGDNYSRNIDCKITGNYDLTKEGEYNLKYTLTDTSNNETIVNVTLIVSNEEEKTIPNTTRTEFKDIYSKYKSDNTEIGIDVSKWQGNIDFEKVKSAGASFVMIRIGSQRQSGNDIYIDEYFKENIKKAHDAGLKVGVYFYSTATTKDEAIRHANWVIKILDGESLDLPIAFDWENWANFNTYKISFYDLNSISESFIKEVEANGYKGMLYSSKFYLETIWTNKNNSPVWLAHYTNKTDYKGDYVIWQSCNNGKIDGISGNVDIDIMYKK